MREFIIQLLESSVCPQYTMNIDQLDGYLYAVAAEPQETAPEYWMPLVFGGEIPSFIEGYSIESVTNALIWLYNSHRAQVLSSQCELVFACEYSSIKMARIRPEQWARGFMQGYIFWEDVWNHYLNEGQTNLNLDGILLSSLNDDLDDILAVISAIADAEYASQIGTSAEDLVLMFNRLPEKVVEYGRIAHMIRTNQPVNGQPKKEMYEHVQFTH